MGYHQLFAQLLSRVLRLQETKESVKVSKAIDRRSNSRQERLEAEERSRVDISLGRD